MTTKPEDCLRSLIARGLDRQSLMRAWLELASTAIGADYADYRAFGFDSSQQALLMCESVFVGSSVYVSLSADVNGRHPFESGFAPATHPALNRPRVRVASQVDAEVLERWWRPYAITSEIALTVSEGREFCGVISFFQTAESDGSFEDNGLTPKVRSWLAASKSLVCTVHLERIRSLPATRSVYIYDDGGDRWKASVDAKQWSADEVRYDLARAKRAILGGAQQRVVFMKTVRISAARLLRERGSFVCVEVEPLMPVHITRFCELTDVQRRVAAAAANGSTIKDIAAEAGRSPETIRSHLRATYGALGIGSRAELAEVYADAMNWGPAPAGA